MLYLLYMKTKGSNGWRKKIWIAEDGKSSATNLLYILSAENYIVKKTLATVEVQLKSLKSI